MFIATRARPEPSFHGCRPRGGHREALTWAPGAGVIWAPYPRRQAVGGGPLWHPQAARRPPASLSLVSHLTDGKEPATVHLHVVGLRRSLVGLVGEMAPGGFAPFLPGCHLRTEGFSADIRWSDEERSSTWRRNRPAAGTSSLHSRRRSAASLTRRSDRREALERPLPVRSARVLDDAVPCAGGRLSGHRAGASPCSPSHGDSWRAWGLSAGPLSPVSMESGIHGVRS